MGIAFLAALCSSVWETPHLSHLCSRHVGESLNERAQFKYWIGD
jgi:hypothetical protein